jgi:HAE1 family hydrophobic/amphiphilic exporter-1
MNLAALFIKRPITTTLITLGIVVFGVMSYRVLPVADLPAIDFPTISVSASLPGASPETMASAVALPLEKQFSTISGLTSMNSTNTQGSTNITLQFDLSRQIDAAAQDVQTMIARATRQLPAQMPAPPSYFKVNPGDYPVMLLVMRSPSLPLSAVNEYADSNAVADRSYAHPFANSIAYPRSVTDTNAEPYALTISDAFAYAGPIPVAVPHADARSKSNSTA